jgi:hypothetical protein
MTFRELFGRVEALGYADREVTYSDDYGGPYKIEGDLAPLLIDTNGDSTHRLRADAGGD